MTRKDGAAIGEFRNRKPTKARGNEVEGVVLRVLGGASEQRGQAFRGDGKHLPGGFDKEDRVMAFNGNAPAAKHAPVLVVENGNENLIAETFFVGVPVDIEEGVVAAVVAVFEHVVPIAVLVAETHVIGNDVEHLPETDIAETLAEPR